MAALQSSRLQTRLNGAASRPTRSSRRVAFKAVASSAFEKVTSGLGVTRPGPLQLQQQMHIWIAAHRLLIRPQFETPSAGCD
jgi:hypothetical protein